MEEKQEKDHALLTMSRSAFCGLMIFNGVAVGAACLASVRPVYVEHAINDGTIESAQELSYLYGLIGLGALISTIIAFAAIQVLKKHNDVPCKVDLP